MRRLVLASLVGFAITLVAPRLASAQVAQCGNLRIGADSTCVFVADAACRAMCTPITVTASCAAELYATCDGMCTLEAQASCTAECQGSCEGSCAVDPGNFECTGSCEARCDGECSAACSGAVNMVDCMASCRATCSGECSASCSGTPPSATCQARCQASCSGSCTARANLDCQVDCQASGYVECRADLQGGCTGDCDASGALFCDGQYVHASDLKACLEYLESQLQIDVSGWVTGQCVGTMCEITAEAKCSCRVGGASSAPPAGALALAGLVLGLASLRRVRRR